MHLTTHPPIHPPTTPPQVLSTLKETDVAAVVVDAARLADTPPGALPGELRWEGLLLERAAAAGATPLLIYNLKVGG